MHIRTRVAPSPTGYPHVGLIYQALFDYVLAHKYGGQFVLRIEDTDRTRFVEGAEDVIYDSLKWVNLMPDEGPNEGGEYGPYRQSERLASYKKYAQQLIDSGHAYYCFCTKERLDEMRKQQEANHLAPMYDKTCRKLTAEEIEKNLSEELPHTVRLKVPADEKIIVHDALVEDVTFESNQIDDQVLLKSDGFPTYHLAVVVDDYLMKISHVIRGTEWLPSFPKHVLIWQYLGLERDMPIFIHVPVLLNAEGGGKLSKRHAHTSVTFYKEEGYLPEAVVNYLANVVWNHPEGKEIFPVMDFGKALDAENNHYDIKAQGVHFDLQKLTWMNGEYIKMMDNEALKKTLITYFRSTNNNIMVTYFENNDKDFIDKILSMLKTRIKTLKEVLNIYLPLQSHDPESSKNIYSDEEKDVAQYMEEIFGSITDWNKDTILEGMRVVLKEKKVKGSVLYKILTGHEHGLPLPESLELLGKEKTLERLQGVA